MDGHNKFTNQNVEYNSNPLDNESLPDQEFLNEDEGETAFALHALAKSRRAIAIDRAKKIAQNHPIQSRKERRRAEQAEGLYGYKELSNKESLRQEIQQEQHNQKSEFEMKYGQFIHFIDSQNELKPNPNLLSDFSKLTSQKDKLKFILSSSLADKLQLFASDFFDESTYENFAQQISLAKQHENTSDSEELYTGLCRSALYSAMLKSPELAAVKIATKWHNNQRSDNLPEVKEVVCLHGFNSGIFHDTTRGITSIGHWGNLCDAYDKALGAIGLTRENASQEQEHDAVLELAHHLSRASNYANGTIFVSDSPYNASFEEAMTISQMSYPVMRRFKGIREKVGLNFTHIERFLRKAGHSQKLESYKKELGKLNGRKKHIETLSDEQQQEFLVKENAFEIKKQTEWREKEIARINHKYDKKISKTRDPERCNIYDQRRVTEIQSVTTDTTERIEYFEHRTIEQLLSDIQARQDVVRRRIEKRKPLADKALDLYFGLNYGHVPMDGAEDEDDFIANPNNSKYAYYIDWINTAPFGLIKRAHKRMSEGMPDDENYELAITELIAKTVSNPDEAKTQVQALIEQDQDDNHHLLHIMRLAQIISKQHTGELDYQELAQMSQHDFSGIEKPLESFSISETRQIQSAGAHLDAVPQIVQLLQQYGYEPSPKEVGKIASLGSYSHEAKSIAEKMLKNFSLDETISAIDSKINPDILIATQNIFFAQEKPDFNTLCNQASMIDSFGYRISAKSIVQTYKKLANRYGTDYVNNLRTPNLTLYNFADAVSDGLQNPIVLKNNPWLIHEYKSENATSIRNANHFPDTANNSAKYNWCATNAFVHLDGNWSAQTIGKIIYTRLQTKIEHSLHDATYWLENFQMPNEAYDISKIKQIVNSGQEISSIEQYKMPLIDLQSEQKLIARILSASKDTKDRLKLSTKPQVITNLFSNPATTLIYESLAQNYQNPDYNYDSLANEVYTNLEQFHHDNLSTESSKPSTWRMDINAFRNNVASTLEQIHQLSQSRNLSEERIGEIMQRLKQCGANRKAYIDDATSWLVKHTTAPSRDLTLAWSERIYAITDGSNDNISEILTWKKTHEISDYILKHPYEIQSLGLTEKEMTTDYQNIISELSTGYGAKEIINFIGFFKKHQNNHKIMPAEDISLQSKQGNYIGSVLAYDDPRGATIGVNTGCCMTLGGASESCIRSGYADSNAGFFAIKDPRGKIMAQSYFYINPEHPDTVVMDNIEANAGRDSNRIIELYQKYFSEYLKSRFANDPNWQIRQVNVGTRYGEVAKAQVLNLSKTDIILNRPSIYTDADSDQRLIIRLSDEEINEAKKSLVSQNITPDTAEQQPQSPAFSPLNLSNRSILQDLESKIYPEENMRQYDDDQFLHDELTQPGVDRYSFFINPKNPQTAETKNYPIGYCVAYEADSEINPSSPQKVVYIADFGVIPEARDGAATLGALEEILSRVNSADDIETIELDARKSTSYRFFTSPGGKRYFARKGFNVIEHDRHTDFGNQEETILISLEKIH